MVTYTPTKYARLHFASRFKPQLLVCSLNSSHFSNNFMFKLTPYLRNYAYWRRSDIGFKALTQRFVVKARGVFYKLSYLSVWGSHKSVLQRSAKRATVISSYGSYTYFISFLYECSNQVNSATLSPRTGKTLVPTSSLCYARHGVWDFRAFFTLSFCHSISLFKRLFFRSWSVYSLRAINFEKRAKLMRLYDKYTLPRSRTASSVDADLVAKLEPQRSVFGNWVNTASKLEVRFYVKNRIFMYRWSKMLFDTRRVRILKHFCRSAIRGTYNQIFAFKIRFFTRLHNFTFQMLRFRSKLMLTMLIKTGHIFVNGSAVTNPHYSISALDVVSISKLAAFWKRSLLRIRKKKRRMGRRFKKELTEKFRLRRFSRRVFMRPTAWRPKFFFRPFWRSVITGPKRRFFILYNRINFVKTLRIRQRRFSFFSDSRVRFLVTTLDF